jgi:hypothetical protein
VGGLVLGKDIGEECMKQILKYLTWKMHSRRERDGVWYLSLESMLSSWRFLLNPNGILL